MSSTAVLDDDDCAGRNLLITVVDRASNARSEPISLDGLPWDKQPSEGRFGLVWLSSTHSLCSLLLRLF